MCTDQVAPNEDLTIECLVRRHFNSLNYAIHMMRSKNDSNLIEGCLVEQLLPFCAVALYEFGC